MSKPRRRGRARGSTYYDRVPVVYYNKRKPLHTISIMTLYGRVFAREVYAILSRLRSVRSRRNTQAFRPKHDDGAPSGHDDGKSDFSFSVSANRSPLLFGFLQGCAVVTITIFRENLIFFFSTQRLWFPDLVDS